MTDSHPSCSLVPPRSAARSDWTPSWRSGPSTRRSSPPDCPSWSEVSIQFRRGKLKPLIVGRANNQFRSDKIVYRRYAGLFFCCCVDSNDNELAYLEAIHLFVEVLGKSADRLLFVELMYRCILPKCLWARSRVFILQSELLDLTAIKSWYIGICDIGWSVLSWRDWGNE